MAEITAYVPCFNNASTVAQAIDSIRRQTVAVAEILVIDDCSRDESSRAAAEAGARVVRLSENRGRGTVRQRAMLEARHEYVLCCDATNILMPDFTIKALSWFREQSVAAAFGPITDPKPLGVVARWRSRHLFKDGVVQPVRRRAVLGTYGAMVRRDAVAAVGGFDPRLRHSEDSDLGGRLLRSGYDVIFDPALSAICNVQNTLPKVLERYWRWYAGSDERVDLLDYVKNIKFSICSMGIADIRAGDPLAALISMLTPHYQIWKSIAAHLRKKSSGYSMS